MLDRYEALVKVVLRRPSAAIASIGGIFLLSFLLFPLLGLAFFPRADAGQFVINLKAPSGTRIEETNSIVAKVESEVRTLVDPKDLRLIVSNIGVIPGFSSIYTSNSGPHTATVQVALSEDHKVNSYEYMNRLRKRFDLEMPEISTFFQSGGIQDAVLNQGLPAPIDVQISGSNLEADNKVALELARRIHSVPGVNQIYIPQDLDYPALRLNVDRVRASELGLSQKEVIDNVITALTSNGMISPSYWIDPKTGNDYMLTVQYAEKSIRSLMDLKTIPLRSSSKPVILDSVSKITPFEAPTEVDHYQIQRVIDVYVTPATEDLGKIAGAIDKIIAGTELPVGVRVTLRGMVQGMRDSFRSFGIGLMLSLLLLYLVLVAQFRSFVDPLLVLLAVPTGLTGVLGMLFVTGTTLNVQSLMGLVMMVGIVVSNSILIVEFAHRLAGGGRSAREAVVAACRVRLRPILMTSLATVFGLIPMALKLGTGSEAYAPLARAIIGGLIVSVALTIFIVPAAYVLIYRRRNTSAETV